MIHLKKAGCILEKFQTKLIMDKKNDKQIRKGSSKFDSWKKIYIGKRLQSQ